MRSPSVSARWHPPLRWRRGLAVFTGGMLGGAARIGLSAWLNTPGGAPWGTLAANVGGALLLGYLLTRFLQAARPASLTIPLWCTGLLGGFTTFSALSLEVRDLLAGGRGGLAAGYAVASVALGLVAAAAGIRLAERRG